jgi:general secretion pathway protein J
MNQKSEGSNPEPGTCIQNPVSSIQHTGFTLLEILIAIFIFSVVVTTIFVSYNSVFSKSETIDKGITTYEMAKNCLDRMAIDLKSIHVSLPPEYSQPDFDDPPDPFRIVGENIFIENNSFSKIRFTSLAHLPLGKNKHESIAEIIYYVQAADDGHFLLKRSDNLYLFQLLEEKASDPVLCENVKSLTFKYYDHEGTEFDLWNSDDEEFGYATPSAVGIKLELDKGSGSKLFETMVTLPVSRMKKE